MRTDRNHEADARRPVIVSAVRTPIGKFRGRFAEIDAYQMGSAVIREAVARSGIGAEELTEVVMGNLLALPGNVARVSAMAAGVPESVPALTLDRQCASGLDAIAYAAAMIMAGRDGFYAVGGTESMTRAPFHLERQAKPYPAAPPAFLPAMFTPPEYGSFPMGETAENLADQYRVTREEQDRFAAECHRKAFSAWTEGRFDEQIAAVPAADKSAGGPGRAAGNIATAGNAAAESDDTAAGGRAPTAMDESIRPDTTSAALARLKPAFSETGSVTAGNSCPMSDGAAVLVVTSARAASERGIQWLMEITGWTAVGLDPRFMGLGPVYAVRKLLEMTGLPPGGIDLFELNEAFAAQALVCQSEIGIPDERLNVNGGAIALGHPLGATGAILAVKLVHEMRRRDSLTGIVTMCVGGGQGVAMLFIRGDR